ncbi:AraC family transcriptional regulator [Clostridium polyendosporum]|uniref:AraC family transcriptional regulator n=1 Tax=Clostridium polyendosporum TaxID=69208 RepID=A0A919VG79_9CLOT|nr:AraC family transcriptional regulator [Clostridium polyendosporum]GIM29145.1 AraC family transcriptional regulator [Clostridium polyendosporum]
MEDANVLHIQQNQFKDLYPCFCGQAQCKPSHSFGPAVRPNYLLHFVLSGKGHYHVGDKPHLIQKNQGFLIYPNVVTYYEAGEKDPWSYIWIGFNGEKADTYLGYAGLNKESLIFQCENGELLKKYVEDMLAHNTLSSTDELRLQGLLFLFFSAITKNTLITAKERGNNTNIYVTKAIEFIQNNYFNDIKVKDIANYVCLNRSYFTTLFQNTVKQSPQQYLSNFRITRAAEMLTLTNLSIGDIARSCGYIDSLIFSKAFKKVKGVSPSVYRKTS